jgi:RNA polymerase sigma-70 factor (ECF subfamily)
MHQSLNFLVEEIRKGSTNSFNKLFSDYYKNLCLFAYTYVKDTDIAEEIVQEIFITIWEQRKTIIIKTSTRAFLYTSVKNRAINYLRDEKTRILHKDQFVREKISKTENIINLYELEELNHILREAIKELPDQCRIIFGMRQNQNLSNRQIANQLNLSVKTVENQIYIAVKKLREKLAPYLFLILLFFK